LNKQTGFSMVQLLISTMLGLLLSSALLSTVIAAISSHRLRYATETVQENIALAEYFMSKDIRAIGFKSCFQKSPSFINNVSKGVVGSDFSAFSAPTVMQSSYKKSDTLVFAAIIHAGAELASDMATPHAQLDLVANSQLQEQQELLITNCESADFFKVSSIWNHRLSHDYSANIDANLSINYPRGSLLYPTSLIHYKIAAGAGGQPGLFRKVGERNYQELIPNVNHFRVELGVFNTLDKTVSYHLSGEKIEQANIVSLRLYLLLSSNSAVLSEKMFYKNFIGDMEKAKDLRFYKAFSIVIALRNSQYLLNLENNDLAENSFAGE